MGTAAIIIQGLEVVIPGIIDLWKAIQGLQTQNPNMTPEQAKALMDTMTAAIKAAGDDELATLALIPPAPAKGVLP